MVKCKYCDIECNNPKFDVCDRHLKLKWAWQKTHVTGYCGQESELVRIKLIKE